ncbi:Kelch repeat-containing protein [Paremcibacter congregatus]|uniref:Galactose oxidase n=1 Tax=Paremcibacter congregatus TaxID=2043170 RepID=A0A2G4YVT1_9PROT|nr:kelch repeat-containing protein [Paremcibacter congregatus]PHZ86373.1 hypothetical protein CRD36_02090 [Paremcibacter congregatus]QDE27982.1 hypothetical protein FIV45_12220 [Paremcibacter congregatus]
MEFSRRNFLNYSGIAALGALSYSGSSFAFGAKKNWVQTSPMPIPMQEIYPAVFEQEIYVGGGFVESDRPAFAGYSPSKETYIYNPEKRLWRQGPTLPEARHHLGMVSNSSYLFAIGGFYGVKGNAWQLRDTVFKLTKDSETWSSGPVLPSSQAESVYGMIEDNIHVVGGKRIEPQNGKILDSDKHYVLVQNEHWEEAAPASMVRNSAAGAVVGDRLYVVGGRGAGSYHLNNNFIEAYDPKLDKWETIKPAPVAVAGHAATARGGKLYIFGGEIFGPGGNWKTGKVYSSVWSYDPHSDEWNVSGGAKLVH